MHLLTERHSVELVQGADRQVVATADLCSEDTLEQLRDRTVTIGGAYFRIVDRDALGRAFDEAFERCEARPGSDASGVVTFADGEIAITRRLAA